MTFVTLDMSAIRAEAEKHITQNGSHGENGTGDSEKPGQPESVLPVGFELRLDTTGDELAGVYHTDDNGEIRICSLLKILAATRDRDGESWGRLLEFKDADGKRHTWAMPMSLLAGDGNEYRSRLLSLGLEITPTRKAKELLARYIQETKPAHRVRCVETVGWHNEAFVLPDVTFGDSKEESVTFQTESLPEHRFAINGMLDGWRRNVSRLCAGNSRLVFAVSIAFAAPLLKLVDEPGGGFHFLGNTSKGKTTALLVAGSVCGGGGNDGFLETWKSTANGLESIAAMHNDALLCLDELKQADPRSVGETAYMLANGQGKRRMSRSINLRRRLEWRLLFLSSGEVSLSSLVEQAGGRIYGGQEVRMCEIPADSGKFGLFENLHEFRSGDALSNHLRSASKSYYGTPLREYLKNLVANLDFVIPEWERSREEFMNEVLPENAPGEVVRVCSRFALVAAAGESAREITGWEKGEAKNAAIVLFRGWLENRKTSGSSDAENAVRQVRAFLEAHGASRFQRIGKTNLTSGEPEFEQTVSNRAGFKFTNPTTDEIEFWILPESFKREVCKGFDNGQVAQELYDRKLLLKGSDGKNSQTRYVDAMKKSVKVYVVLSRIFEDDALQKAPDYETYEDANF